MAATGGDGPETPISCEAPKYPPEEGSVTPESTLLITNAVITVHSTVIPAPMPPQFYFVRRRAGVYQFGFIHQNTHCDGDHTTNEIMGEIPKNSQALSMRRLSETIPVVAGKIIKTTE